MIEEVKSRLDRIETKVDVLITSRTNDLVELEKTKVDMFWVKGGLAVVLSIILSGASWLAMEFFSK